ncbi:MAG: terminase small subunit [Candidatus Binatia bacterium]
MGRGSLTLKQRRFLKHYIATGNGTAAALVAYDTRDPDTAHAIAVETLRSPTVQATVTELLDREGISDRKLHRIHAHFLALYRSADPREKALGLKALDMAYRLTGAYGRDEAEADRVFDGWTGEELDHFAATGEWPRQRRPAEGPRTIDVDGVEEDAPEARVAVRRPRSLPI